MADISSYFTFLQSASDSNWTRVPLVADFALGFASLDTTTNTAVPFATSSTNYISVNSSGQIQLNTIDTTGAQTPLAVIYNNKITKWTPALTNPKHLISLNDSNVIINSVTSIASLTQASDYCFVMTASSSDNTYAYFKGNTTSNKLYYLNSGILTARSTPIGNSNTPIYYSSDGGFTTCGRTLIDVQYASGILTITK